MHKVPLIFQKKKTLVTSNEPLLASLGLAKKKGERTPQKEWDVT